MEINFWLTLICSGGLDGCSLKALTSMTNRDLDVLTRRYDLGEPIAPLDMSGLLRSIWTGKWIILLTTICAILVVGYYAFFHAVPAYSATATIKIELSERHNNDLTFLEISPAVLSTEAAVLRSRHLLEQVIVMRALEADPEFNRYLSPIPDWSLTGIRNRIRALLTRQTEPMPGPQTIREKTIDNLAKMLTINPERGTYLFAVTATTSSPEKSRVVANALADAYLADQAQARTAETEAAVAQLRARASQLQDDLQRKETAINTLLSAGQLPDETLFDTLSRQAIEVDQRLAEAYRARAQNSALISGNDRQITALEAFRDRLTGQIASQSAGLIELQQLRREAQSTRALYTSLLAELEQTQILRGTDLPTARILSPATQGRYVAPRKTYILAIAALLGAVVGVVYVFAQRQRYIQTDTIAALSDRAVIGQFPAQILQKRAFRNLTDQPLGPLANAATQLRTQIIGGKSAPAPQVIVSTSCGNNDARTQVTVMLGSALARLGGAVLVIDTDFYDRHLSRLLPEKVPFTLCDVISGHAPLSDAVYRHASLGIDLLYAAPAQQNPADMLASAGFARMLDEARANYAHIVIDAAPVLAGAGALIGARSADAAVLTLRARKTRAQDFRQAQNTLAADGAASRGIIIVTG